MLYVCHRDCSDEVLPEINKVVEKCINEYCIEECIVGSYGKFDGLAAKSVIEAKHKYPYIHLTMLLPYLPAEKKIQIPKEFDGTVYPEGQETVPKRIAIVRVNRYMVDYTDVLIAHVWHTASNARNLLDYAEKNATEKERMIILIQKMNYMQTNIAMYGLHQYTFNQISLNCRQDTSLFARLSKASKSRVDGKMKLKL